MILPLAVVAWRPSSKVVTQLAWAYVIGQMISTAYAYVHPIEAQGRSFGWTTHPNFFGIGGQTAYALLVFLFYRTPPRRRWILLIPAAVVGQSVLMSGSRASLLCIMLVTIAWPLVERTAISWYVLVSGGIIAAALANPILSASGESSAISRLAGNITTGGSNLARTEALSKAWHEFLDKPFTGSGFIQILDVHNAYLEVVVGGGLLALIGYVMMLSSLCSGLLRPVHPNRMAYVALSYAAFALIGPTLWDRIVWAALTLVFANAQNLSEDDDPPRARASARATPVPAAPVGVPALDPPGRPLR
jgi:O-antigen ligase